MARKIIDRKDFLADLDRVVAPKFFPTDVMDKNRVSGYGFLLEALAKMNEDTVTLEQRRAADYCPELSSSEVRVMQTAKLWNLGVARATPGQCFAVIRVLKSDVISRGERTGNEIKFVIDRRSEIVYHNVNFSLEDDIIIRAVQTGSEYTFAVMYSGERASTTSYIQLFEETDSHGDELLTMICRIFQYRYNIQDKVVTDDLEFLYDGLAFDYDNRLAGFEAYFKRSSSDIFQGVALDHYLTMNTKKVLFYNDDASNILYILNNPDLNIGINSTIRVEIRETLGQNGMINISDDDDMATFALYKDGAYNYSGVNVMINIISDVTGGSDGDSMVDLQKKMIDAKTRRDNITTEHDIVSYINDQDANLQLVNKRNDTEDRIYHLYTLVRYGEENHIAPATTKPLVLKGIQSASDFGDFDHYDPVNDLKILRAYNKFKLVVIGPDHPDFDPSKGIDQDYVVKVPLDENEEGAYYLTCPYMILVDNLELSALYFTSINTQIELFRKPSTDTFPFQFITQKVSIFRDAHDPVNADTYTFTVTGTMNTGDDNLLLDANGNLIDPECIKGYVVFNREGSPAAYMELKIAEGGYNPDQREFTLVGKMKTNDSLVPDRDTIEITDGLFAVKTGAPYDSTIDFSDSDIQLFFTYKNGSVIGDYSKSSIGYSLIPEDEIGNDLIMCGYQNVDNHKVDLILEYNKFSRSPTYMELEEVGGSTYRYTLKEVPFFQFDFGVKNTCSLYETFKHMYEVYGNLLKQTTDFEVSLKFIATYGSSKYITVTGGQTEEELDLADLNPKFRFRVYGRNLKVDDLYDFIYRYLRENYIISGSMFVSNICTAVEQNFSNVRSIKFLGVNDLDASYQEFNYKIPSLKDVASILSYIPEQFNVTDIEIEIDES